MILTLNIDVAVIVIDVLNLERGNNNMKEEFGLTKTIDGGSLEVQINSY